MSDHIAKAYDNDISALKTQLAEMGGIAEEQLANAIQSLIRRDTALADQVIRGDELLDNLERRIEEKAILTIAKRQPMAHDLREIIVAIRVSSDIERIGDLAKNTAKRTHAISEALPRNLSSGLTRMGKMAQTQLNQVLNAYEHAKESDIVSEAGLPGQVTISTNMAGRGTDILLGGKQLDASALERYPEEQREQFRKEWEVKHKAVEAQVRQAGGLHE